MTAGTASASATSGRSDFTHVLMSGAKIGAITATAVVLCALLSFLVPPAGSFRQGTLALIVLATAVLAAFLPGQWAAARTTQGIATAAAIGLFGTVVFTVVDIGVLRPLNHVVTIYPWTWDRVGGGSTWWYLPVWWMLGTFLAWMGGIVTADRAARGETTLARLALPASLGAIVLATVARLAGLGIDIAVAAGAAFTITLTVLAVVAIARKV